jgi:hypothetical protein
VTCGSSTSKGETVTISVKQNNTYAAATGVWVKVNGVWKQVATSGLDGLGTWATLSRATGSPKRYEYPDSESTWVAYRWTAAGSVTMTEGLVDALLIGGGMGYMTNLSNPGGGGSVVTNIIRISSGGNLPIEIGVGKPAGNNYEQYTGTPTRLGEYHTGYSYGAGFSYSGTTVSNVPERGEPYPSSITGSPETYAGGKKNSTTRFGDGGVNGGNSGRNGVVIVRIPKEFDNIPSSDYVTRIDYYAEVTDGIVTDTYQERFYGDGSVRTENGRYASPEQPDDLIPCDPSVAEGWTYLDGEFTPPPPPPPPTREELIEALQEQIKDLQKDQ